MAVARQEAELRTKPQVGWRVFTAFLVTVGGVVAAGELASGGELAPAILTALRGVGQSGEVDLDSAMPPGTGSDPYTVELRGGQYRMLCQKGNPNGVMMPTFETALSSLPFDCGAPHALADFDDIFINDQPVECVGGEVVPMQASESCSVVK